MDLDLENDSIFEGEDGITPELSDYRLVVLGDTNTVSTRHTSEDEDSISRRTTRDLISEIHQMWGGDDPAIALWTNMQRVEAPLYNLSSFTHGSNLSTNENGVFSWVANIPAYNYYTNITPDSTIVYSQLIT